MSRCFWRGTYTSWQRGQKTFTRDVDSSSDRPMGRTTYRSHRIRWHMPKAPSRNFSRIMASPRGDRIKRACISPYKSIAAWYTSRKLEKHANRVIIRHVMKLRTCSVRATSQPKCRPEVMVKQARESSMTVGCERNQYLKFTALTSNRSDLLSQGSRLTKSCWAPR